MTRLIMLVLLGVQAGMAWAQDIVANTTPSQTSESLTEGDYTYRTNDLGHAAIIAFNKDYSGELVITNTLGGCPVTAIGKRAFLGHVGLTSVTIPDSVNIIERNAFGHCTNLTSVMIPDGVTSVEVGAFDYTGMTNLMIGSGVTNGAAFFFSCRNLANITVAEDNPVYISVGGVLFNKEQTLLLKFPTARAGDYVIPNGVTAIQGWTFQGCTGLTSVTIPGSVTRIGVRAFGSCRALTSVTIPDSVTNIGNGAFSGCAGLTNVTIGGGNVRIGEMAFSYCPNLVNLTIPASVTNIGFKAFSDCIGLTNRPVEAGISQAARPDNTDYQARRRQRRIQRQQGPATMPVPHYTGAELQKHLEHHQMNLIRQGLPPTPVIRPTKEMDAQLVKEGRLSPNDGGPAGVIYSTDQTNEPPPRPENGSGPAEGGSEVNP